MEDAATAEICRAQLWQWIRHGATLADGRVLTAELAIQLMRQEHGNIVSSLTLKQVIASRFAEAADLFEAMMTEARFSDFLTLEAYHHLD
jgi:malate synthase